MEINPFHNGHEYFLKKAREIAGDNILVCIISTNFVQRGELSVLTKDVKTRLLLSHGVDIVCELPTVLANQGGEFFALSALNILASFNIDTLIFGSESSDLNQLRISANNLETTDFKNGVHSNLGILKSNDILGISYIRACNKLNLNINFELVKRVSNNYNDTTVESKIASATAIRNNLDNVQAIKDALPADSLQNIVETNHELLFDMFKVNLLNCIDNKVNIFLSEQGQLLNRLKIGLDQNPNTLLELLELCKDKNNSQYKYQRIVINVILMITADDYLQDEYIRILGFNPRASKFIPKQGFTNLADCNNKVATIEKRSSSLFSLLTANFQYNEFDRKPLIYKEINGF